PEARPALDGGPAEKAPRARRGRPAGTTWPPPPPPPPPAPGAAPPAAATTTTVSAVIAARAADAVVRSRRDRRGCGGDAGVRTTGRRRCRSSTRCRAGLGSTILALGPGVVGHAARDVLIHRRRRVARIGSARG